MVSILVFESLIQIAIYDRVLRKEVMVGLLHLAPAALTGLAMVIVSRLMVSVLTELAKPDASFVSIGL